MSPDFHGRLPRASLMIRGEERDECELCGRTRRCFILSPLFTADQRIEMRVCPECLNRVSKAVNDAVAARFLQWGTDDAMKAAIRATMAMEAASRKVREQSWEETAVFLVRLLGTQRAAENKIALIRIVRGFTWTGLADSRALVESALARAERPLELLGSSAANGQTRASSL